SGNKLSVIAITTIQARLIVIKEISFFVLLNMTPPFHHFVSIPVLRLGDKSKVPVIVVMMTLV
ncbi:hypothetical protein KKJ04_25575, partial [Xenorhabdus bovienii]|uniref:hypothetical protein n=1 Tax=Xenorhabdus bovienii TaxID=40576 RepID=UPI0023B227D3